MRTKQEMFLDLMGSPATQFVIPVYQRVYSWTQRQCRELWFDIMRAGKGGRVHFLSTVLYMPEEENDNGCAQLDIIDGQQRTATVTLILAALVKYLREHPEVELDGIDADGIEKRYLHTDGENGPVLRLVLSRTDRDTLKAVVDGTELPAEDERSQRVIENYGYFCKKMEEDGFDANRLWNGIRLLSVIDAQVDGHDHAQLIFESLNSKGMPLTTADLVRNYLLIAKSHEEQTRLYDEYWKPIEEMFVPDPDSTKLDNAIQGWMQVRMPKVRALDSKETYSIFKTYMEDNFDGTTEDLLEELRGFCLVWAENYHYHAVKKFRSAFDWAKTGSKTLVSDYDLKEADTPVKKPTYRDIDVYL